MAENSTIQWTNHTWNPWHGCVKVSAGCKFCYMYRDKERFNQDPKTVIRSVPATFNKPLSWKNPALVFTCSWSDWFIQDADEWRVDAWEIIKQTPWLNYQILTKRPERIMECLPPDWGEGYKNVWLGVSVENQETFNNRVQILASVPAHLRFLSIEPLLGPLRFVEIMRSGSEKYPFDKIGWVIVGGESGNYTGKYGFRECSVKWIETIVVTCQFLKIPVFVKQMGTFISRQLGMKDQHGGDITEFPESLQIREYPTISNFKND